MVAELLEVDVSADGSDKTPLILIHDGGGTVFQYFMMGDLHRPTWAIPNPYFESDESPSLPILAEEYARAIRATIRSGPIIIGGWSFGGIISIEIARLLQDDAVKVKGILMIDSPCPWALGSFNTASTPSFRETTSEKMKQLTMQSYANARKMMSSWVQPEPFSVPRAVLIRAKESRMKDDENDGRLGWSKFNSSLEFMTVVDVPGDHWTMWDETRLDNLTEKIKHGCDELA